MFRHLLQSFRKRNEFYTGHLEPTYTNWNIINQKDLYLGKVSESQRKQSLHLLTEKTIFHAYWHGTFGLKQAFSVKSFLCTQNQEHTELWLWLDAADGYSQIETNPYLQELKSRIKILSWNADDEIANTPLLKIKKYINMPKNLAARGDDFRIISLYKYGGVYFDLDVMFLKDFTPLLMGHEFVYAWEYQPYANSALLYLRKNSYITNYLAQKFLERKEAMPWVLFDYKDKKLANLRNYPCAFFDPLWGGYCEGMPFKEFADFFKRFDNGYEKEPHINSYKDFFPGAFAYHWHNKWDAKEFDDSYFGLFNCEFNKMLSQNEI